MNWYKKAEDGEVFWIATTSDGRYKTGPLPKEEALEKQKDFQSEGHPAKIVRASKTAQVEQTESNIGMPNINVQPYEPLVIEAISELLQSERPGILDDVTDINIDLGYGQFGSVTNVSPNTITLNMNNIKEEAARKSGRQISGSDPRDANILKFYIKQTIMHELGHIESYKSTDPTNPWSPGGEFEGGESPAEKRQKEFIEKNPY
jgi:hypothetical protein